MLVVERNHPRYSSVLPKPSRGAVPTPPLSDFYVRCGVCRHKVEVNVHVDRHGDLDIVLTDACTCNPKRLQADICWQARDRFL